MDFGVVVSSGWNFSEIIDTAILAETNGLDFFLVTDHYLFRQSSSSLDAWTILAAVAARTDKIRIGTCVTPIPFRPPQILAKIVSTVDHISSGRCALGVGAGWFQPEFEAYSTWDNDKSRVARTIEGIKLITKLWTSGEPFDFRGKYYSANHAILEPKSVQEPHIPLWFGTTGDFMLKTAAKYADAWLPKVPGEEFEMYKSVISRLRKFESEIGRTSKVRVNFNGTIEEISKDIESYQELGCEGAILVRTPHERVSDALRRLGREIIPSYR